MMAEELQTMSGKVSQVARKDGAETGIKLEGREEEWINFSKFRGHFEMPKVGDSVKLGVERWKDTLFIKTCEVLKCTSGAGYEAGQVPSGGRDLSITRSVAIKAATDVAVALINNGRYQDELDFGALKQLGIDIPALAQDLERFMLRDEISFE